MQPDLFRETADAGPPGDDARTPEPSRSAKRRRHTMLTIRQRRALARLAERQKAYNRTHSWANWFRLRDARADALKLGV